jgi:hypothetical protein
VNHRIPQKILDHPHNWLLRQLQHCVDEGILRYYTEEEMSVACAPLAKEILQKIDRKVVKILLEQSHDQK